MRLVLTGAERRALRAGQHVRIVRPVQPEIATGTVVALNHAVKIVVRGARRAKGGSWVVQYTLHDHRPRLLRQTPPIHDPKASHDPTEDTTEVSNYTTSYHGTVPSAGEATPAEYDRVLKMQARERAAERNHSERREQQVREDVRRFSARMRDDLLALERNGQPTAHLLAQLHRVLDSARQLR